MKFTAQGLVTSTTPVCWLLLLLLCLTTTISFVAGFGSLDRSSSIATTQPRSTRIPGVVVVVVARVPGMVGVQGGGQDGMSAGTGTTTLTTRNTRFLVNDASRFVANIQDTETHNDAVIDVASFETDDFLFPTKRSIQLGLQLLLEMAVQTVSFSLTATRAAFVGALLCACTITTISTTTLLLPTSAAAVEAAVSVVDTGGASVAANAKLTTGGASTLQSGRTISITRGVNLDNSNFAQQNLHGVAFQQSVVRNADFTSANLVGASFFDATVDGSNFSNADMTLSNIEMAQFNRAILKNTILRDVYVSGATLFTGVKDIEGSDWTDTYLRADQQKYLCQHPTAKGSNPTTGVDTRESLMCKD